jgi:probable phosphoglycerate mutase
MTGMSDDLSILLCRHGQSEGNQSGRFGGHGPTPLTALGRAQARATALRLEREGGLTAIYSSDLPRAVETAIPIAEATGIALLPTEDLRERSVGALTGLTFDEARERYPDAYAALMRRDAGACPPGGETHAECTARAVRRLGEIVDRFTVGRVLLVSHAFAIDLLLRHVLGLRDNPLDPRVYFKTDNCALHRLHRLPSGVWRIEALNDRAHLETV